MDAKKHNDLTKLVSKGNAKEIEKVMRRGGADASNLAAMMAKARRNNPPPKQARWGIQEQSSMVGDMRGAVENNPSLYAAAPAIGAGLGGLYGAFTAPPGRGLLSTLRGAAVGGLGGAGFSAALHPDAELQDGSKSIRFNPFAAGSIGLSLANKVIPKLPEQEEKYPDPKDYGDDSAPEDTRTYSKKPKDKKKKDAPMNDKDNKDPKKAKGEKQADALAAMGGGLAGLLSGGLGGLGVGGLYGLVSGAYNAERGKKFQGALRGLRRGAVGGVSIGGGLGLGAGLGAGLSLPTGAARYLVDGPFSSPAAASAGAKMNWDPDATASKAILSALAGGGLGAVVGNYDRQKALEREERHNQEKKQAALKLSPHTGIKTPNKQEAGKNFNKMIEQARRNREDKEQRMRAVNSSKSQIFVDSSSKAASAWGRIKQALGYEFTDDQLKWAPVVGAGLGGAFGLTSKKNKLRNALIGAISGGGAGLGAQFGYKQLAQPWTTDEKATRMAIPALRAGQSVAQFGQTPQEQIAMKTQLAQLENMWHARGLAGGLAGAAIGALPGSFVRDSFPEEQDDDPVWAGKNKKKKPEEKKKEASNWKPFDYSKAGPGGLISTRALPKSDGTGGASHWKASPGVPQKPALKTLPPQLKRPPLVPVAAGKAASAFEFGQWLKQAAIDWNSIGETAKQVWNDPTTQAGVQYGGIGAGLGGLYGLINPGEYEDEYGDVRRRGRLMGALRGAAGGGLLGGAVGAGAQEGRHQYLKHMLNQRAGFPNAMSGLDRSEQIENTEAFARNNPDAVGPLAASPVGSLRDAYSQYVAPQMARFKPKKPVGQAPSTGVDPQTVAPKMPNIDSPGPEIYGD
jgi:hypothetical protein